MRAVGPHEASSSEGFTANSVAATRDLLQCLCLADANFAWAGKRFLFCGGHSYYALQPLGGKEVLIAFEDLIDDATAHLFC